MGGCPGSHRAAKNGSIAVSLCPNHPTTPRAPQTSITSHILPSLQCCSIPKAEKVHLPAPCPPPLPPQCPLLPPMPQHSRTHQHMLLLLLTVQGMRGDNETCLRVDGERPPRETSIGHLSVGTCRRSTFEGNPVATPRTSHLAHSPVLPSSQG